MARWVTSAKPSAELTAIDPDPVLRDDGSTVQRFQTRFGAEWARVVDKTGLVIWFQQVPG